MTLSKALLFLGLGFLTFLLWNGLHSHPNARQQHFGVGQPLPELHLHALSEDTQDLTPSSLHGRPAVLHFFATWCGACRSEHPLWVDLARDHSKVPIYGVAYQDEEEAVAGYLHEAGDPYDAVFADREGQAGNVLALRGVPTTYVVDAKGVLRWVHTGTMTRKLWQESILPLIEHMTSEE